MALKMAHGLSRNLLCAVTALSVLLPMGTGNAAWHWEGEHKVYADDWDSGAQFGRSIAIDGRNVVIGAWTEDDSHEWYGSVYVFDVLTGEQVRKLAANDAQADDGFGAAVSIWGNTIVVGTVDSEWPVGGPGSAYVFDAASGEQIHKLIALDGDPGDEFGSSVAFDGQYIVVGAPMDDDACQNDPDPDCDSGAAYVFDAATGEQLHKLTANDLDPLDEFGYSVAISDGTIVVGARRGNGEVDWSGSAYVFDAATGQQIHELTASDGEEADQFGYSVAIDGDSIVVGAKNDDTVYYTEGSAYLFDAVTGQQLRKFVASDSGTYGDYGCSVAIRGDWLVIGAPNAPYSDSGRGAAYVYDVNTGEQIQKLTVSGLGQDFAETLAIDGNAIVVGASGDRLDKGAACFFLPILGHCPADITGSGGAPDGLVDVFDLLLVLAQWGSEGPDADITGTDWAPDGVVDVTDLLEVLAAWGPCPGMPYSDMVSIPGGEFEMGCHEETGESCWDWEYPVHTVSLSPFNISVYETTNEQYRDFLNAALEQGEVEMGMYSIVNQAGGGEPYFHTFAHTRASGIYWDGTRFIALPGWHHRPVVVATWYGAVAYANWRSATEGLQPAYDLDTWECDWTANGYRLPTEAEWEYAARGGEHDPYFMFPWGNTADGSMGNFYQSGDPYDYDKSQTTPVGFYDGNQVPPGTDMVNGYGLYDMAGNVCEWCNDWLAADYYASSPPDNPYGPDDGIARVFRGGSWLSHYLYSRCAYRNHLYPDHAAFDIGFRLVRNAR